jgi:hypothetical protein
LPVSALPSNSPLSDVQVPDVEPIHVTEIIAGYLAAAAPKPSGFSAQGPLADPIVP